MSRAFIKEDGPGGDDLPERPLSREPNYVTRRGLAMLRARALELADLREKLKSDPSPLAAGKLRETERDLRYAAARIESAILVDNAGRTAEDVLFGATVTARDPSGALHRFSIVGQDEADAASGRLSWTSPLASALLGSKAGDQVRWPREEGELTLEIVEVRYPAET